MSLIRSGSTLVLLFSSGSRQLARAGLAVADLFQRRRRLGARRPRQGRAAVDVLLADQRLRADLAGGVFAEVLEAGVGDLHHDHGLARDRLGLAVFVGGDLARHRDPDRFDLADVGAGDTDLLALDHEAAVVEDPAHDVAAVAAAAGGDEDDRDDRGDQQQGAISPFAGFHGPGGASAGLHSTVVTPEPVCGGSTNGLEPSGCGLGAGARAAALDGFGRAERFVLLARRDRFQFAGVVVEDVEVGEGDPRVVAVGVVVAGDLAELGEAVEDVRRVGAGEVEVRLEVGDPLFGVGEGLGGALLDRGQGGEQLGRVIGLARAGGP